jgi:hypothetical protein
VRSRTPGSACSCAASRTASGMPRPDSNQRTRFRKPPHRSDAQESSSRVQGDRDARDTASLRASEVRPRAAFERLACGDEIDLLFCHDPRTLKQGKHARGPFAALAAKLRPRSSSTATSTARTSAPTDSPRLWASAPSGTDRPRPWCSTATRQAGSSGRYADAPPYSREPRDPPPALLSAFNSCPSVAEPAQTDRARQFQATGVACRPVERGISRRPSAET